MEFEHTPREMAEKLMEFNRDFSTDSTCGEENEEKELDYERSSGTDSCSLGCDAV